MSTLTFRPMSSRALRLVVAALAVAALVSPWASAQASPAFAPMAAIVVNDAGDTTGTCSTNGTGTCTLRDAITFANANSGADTITFNIPNGGACSSDNTCTITLGSSLPDITSDVTIDGAPNSGRITVSGAGLYRILRHNAGTLTLNALTLANGNSAVQFTAGGGAIDARGGTLNVTNSTFRDNTTSGSGGAIEISSSSVVNVTNCTFSNNSTKNVQFGGAIWNGGTLNVTNSTFSDNSAGSGGQGGGIYNQLGTLTLSNTIIANSQSGGDCVKGGGTVTGSYNLIEDGTNACGLTNGVNNNIVGSDPNLAALDSNGGPTQTMALNSPSQAIDTGDNVVCAAAPVSGVDQRGYGRPAPSGGVCDRGAYEANAVPLAVTLAGFDAAAQAGHVLVTWETVSETGNAGFNLYRTQAAQAPTAADLLASVPSQAPGSTQGFAYAYQDNAVTAGESYWYWLEDVSLSGVTTLHGPVSVIYVAPTAVTLSGLEATQSGPALAWPWLAGLLAAALAGAVLVWRRRSAAA